MEELKRHIREIPDFPEPGISFKDITPLLSNGPVFRRAVDAIGDLCEKTDLRPDVLACPEARGFIFGAALAYRLGIGFIAAIPERQCRTSRARRLPGLPRVVLFCCCCDCCC